VPVVRQRVAVSVRILGFSSLLLALAQGAGNARQHPAQAASGLRDRIMGLARRSLESSTAPGLAWGAHLVAEHELRELRELAPLVVAKLPDACGSPSASIDYEIGDEPDNYAWAGQEGVPPFTQIDVFDAQGVDLHVDGELTYIYTPSELAVFRFTHDGIEAVKAKLEKARRTLYQPATRT